MRIAIIACLTALLFGLAGLAGCGPVRPMTQSEFNGFCYQTSTPRFTDCDNISVCNGYSTAFDMQNPSFAKCMAECDAVHSAQYMTYVATGCATVNESAWDWCQRYCRTNYPQ